MKFHLSTIFSPLFLLSSAFLQAEEVAAHPILAWRGKEIIWLERELNEVEGDRAVSALAEMAQAQLADLSGPEKALGLHPLFPEGTLLDGIETEGNVAQIAVRFPSSPPWQGEEAVINETISHLLGQWRESLPGIDTISLHVKRPGGDRFFSVESAIPAPASKPEPPPPVEEGAGAMQPMSVPQAPGHGNAQPAGALSDASIFLSPGHGWHYSTGAGRWATQRGNYHQYIEDMGNAEAVLQYLHQYLWNAGARIYTTRERDLNTNMVIVNHGGQGYSQTGSWTTENVSSAYGGSHRRAFTVTGEPTATARFTPNIPEAGHYAVYVWYRRSTAGTTTADARITVNHTGDSTLWVQNQNNDGYTWKYIGTYYFEEGSNPETGSVLIDNQSSVSGNRVIANAVRFGGGMGDMPDNVSGTISGKPRWEESGRYYAGFLGKTDWALSSQITGMSRWAAWEHESWETGKSVYVSWHTNGFNGSARGTETIAYTSGNRNGPFNGVTGGDILRNNIHDQVIHAIKTAWDSSWPDRGKITQDLAELNPSYNPAMPAALVEVGFHDNLTDAKHLLDPEFRRQVARAVYQGLVKFYAGNSMLGFSNSTYLPEPPQRLRVKSATDGSVTLNWEAPPFSTGTAGLYGHAATGYRVYRSKNGHGFDNGFSVTGTTATISDIAPGEVVYLRVSARNAGGESFPTATLGVRPADDSSSRLLIVNGFNRTDRFMNVIEPDPHSANTRSRGYLNRLNTYNYIVPHAKAIEAYPEVIGFDSAEADAIESGAVSLLDYDAVIWMAGLQAHVNDIGTREFSAFPGSLISKVATFLNQEGGSLFLSGAEVAWDSNRRGLNGWLNQILRSEFLARDASSLSVSGISNSIMAGWSAGFDSGSGLAYRVESPDVIAPINGSETAMTYGGSTKIAAIQYDENYRLVYMAFPFESITSEVQQADLMARSLDFFGFSLTPFESWQRTHFTADELENPDISGDLADASGDGIPNIVKYALNLDPRASSRDGLPEVSVEGDFLILRFNQAKEATDIAYDVEVSDDLVSWESGDDEVEFVSTVDEGDTWEVTVRDRAPFPENERRFIRLRVTRQ